MSVTPLSLLCRFISSCCHALRHSEIGLEKGQGGPKAPKNACKDTRRIHVTLSATGDAQVKRTRMGDGHSARTFLGKAGREAAKVQRVLVLTLSALDVNPGCKESVRDWLIRVVHTRGLLDGKRAAVVVSADMGIGAHVREVLDVDECPT